jgi:hypothetical protein
VASASWVLRKREKREQNKKKEIHCKHSNWSRARIFDACMYTKADIYRQTYTCKIEFKAANGRRQTADGRRQTADGRQQTADGTSLATKLKTRVDAKR